MPVKLRLRRQGRSKAVHYSVVAADVRSPRDGRYIEKIGYFDPLREPAHLHIDEEAAIRWLQNGAQPTHTVRQLLRHAGITLKHALIMQVTTEEQVQEIFDRWCKEKQKMKKRILVRVDVAGNLLDELPPVAVPANDGAADKDPASDAAASGSDEAPAAEANAEEAPVAEAAAEEAPAAEASTEEAPAAEAATEEAPAEEAAADEEEKTEE